jgi:hypothetical protein
MANQTGARTTFNDTVGLKIDLSDMLPVITTPSDTPLFTRLPKKAPVQPAILHQWLEDTLPASTDALGAMYTAAGGTIVVTDFTLFKKGYVLKIEAELMRVTTTPTTTTVTVSTAYAGTANVNHANAVAIDIIGYAVTDGADPEQFATTNRTVASNYMQVFQEKIEVSDLDMWAGGYGIQDKYSYEVEKWLRVLAIRSEKGIIHGRANSDSTNNTRTFGGLLSFITTNATAVAGALTETNLNDSIQLAYAAGGVPTLIVASPKQRRKITGLIAATQKYYPRMGGSEAAGGSVTQYISDFGTLDVITDRHLPTDTIFILEEGNVAVIEGMPFTLENLGRTGTARKGQIVGWYTVEVKAQAHSAVMTGLT